MDIPRDAAEALGTEALSVIFDAHADQVADFDLSVEAPTAAFGRLMRSIAARLRENAITCTVAVVAVRDFTDAVTECINSPIAERQAIGAMRCKRIFESIKSDADYIFRGQGNP